MGRKRQSKLTEGDKEFVKDLSRKLILRAYLRNSANIPRSLVDKLKHVFIKKLHNAPTIDIFKAIENNRK